MSEADRAEITGTQPSEASEGHRNKTGIVPLILMALAVAYVISPIDIVPDVAPGVGWLDDIVVVLSAGFNMLEKYLKAYSLGLARIVNLLKWGVISLGVMAVTLIVLGVAAIVNLFA